LTEAAHPVSVSIETTTANLNIDPFISNLLQQANSLAESFLTSKAGDLASLEACARSIEFGSFVYR
jgi:hypothetical protein